MQTKRFLFLAAIALCGGCENMQSVTTALPAAVPAPATARVAGTDLDQHNVEKVRVSETLKSYPVGRFVDPNDPNVMHEAHVVYRKEAGAGWNLNPNAPTVVPLGPVLAVADPARTPNPLPAELEQKMSEQNQLVASLIEQNDALAKEIGKLGREIADLRLKTPAAAKEDSK